MPYISKEAREHHDWGLSAMDIGGWTKAGVLNYVITKLVLRFLGGKPNYDRFNEALGVLEAVKQELYRRKVAPYEDEKKEANGDVFLGSN